MQATQRIPCSFMLIKGDSINCGGFREMKFRHNFLCWAETTSDVSLELLQITWLFNFPLQAVFCVLFPCWTQCVTSAWYCKFRCHFWNLWSLHTGLKEWFIYNACLLNWMWHLQYTWKEDNKTGSWQQYQPHQTVSSFWFLM